MRSRLDEVAGGRHAPYPLRPTADRGAREGLPALPKEDGGAPLESNDRRDRRLRNEKLFRTVNNKLRELNVEFEGFADETALFVCECSRLECIEQLTVAVAVFDAVCARPGQFVLVPGHELPEIDRVVERNGPYLVVQKPDLS